MKKETAISGTLQEAEFAQGVLDSLVEPAILINRDYEVLLSNAPYRQRYGLTSNHPKRKCYQVSHHYERPCDQAGESCPLKTCLETEGRAKVLHIHFSKEGREYVNVEMWPIRNPNSGEIDYFIEQIFPVDRIVATEPNQETTLVGSSRPFQQMIDLAQRVAPSNATVMLLGETGTGKELVAQTIHKLSNRRDEPFVPVECTGLPEALFESELFGYVKGAFTGAISDKTGLVESAQGGTLFLDEVGEIPLQDQVKLLRLLETRRYRKLGSADWHTADFRLVCATNRDLRAMVKNGEFREDLYYRLSVFEINLPPLRERVEDLPALVQRMFEDLDAGHCTISDDALALLQAHDYPGNIRELRNIIERALLLADDRVVLPRHLPDHLRPDQSINQPEPFKTLAEAETEYLQRAVANWTGDRKSLARALGLSERALYRKLSDLKT
jgi:transcriptional regulator with PAS, ATPase and Fis domain